jgi:hypothetical protein
MMLTLSTQLVVPIDVDHLDTINRFANTQLRAKRAIELSSNEFNVDDGQNDLRAYWNPYDRSFRFIARYKKEACRMERCVKRFIEQNPALSAKTEKLVFSTEYVLTLSKENKKR